MITDTLPVGNYHFAEAYRKAAQVLVSEMESGPHHASPVRYNYYHSIELYLKTFLVIRGYNERDLKGLGHRYGRLVDKVRANGLELEDIVDLDFAALIDEGRNYSRERYIERGAFHVPTLEFLDISASDLACAVLRN